MIGFIGGLAAFTAALLGIDKLRHRARSRTIR